MLGGNLIASLIEFFKDLAMLLLICTS